MKKLALLIAIAVLLALPPVASAGPGSPTCTLTQSGGFGTYTASALVNVGNPRSGYVGQVQYPDGSIDPSNNWGLGSGQFPSVSEVFDTLESGTYTGYVYRFKDYGVDKGLPTYTQYTLLATCTLTTGP